MNIEIGIISGQILELLDKRNGLIIFGDIQSALRQPNDLVMMSLGWLLGQGYIHILEDPLRVPYINRQKENGNTSEAFMFDLIIENKYVKIDQNRIKNMTRHINAVASKILILLKGFGDGLTLQNIEENLNEHRELVLMSLGWLIREGYLQRINGSSKAIMFRILKEIPELDSQLVCHS